MTWIETAEEARRHWPALEAPDKGLTDCAPDLSAFFVLAVSYRFNLTPEQAGAAIAAGETP